MAETADAVVVGGGVFGLWAAHHLAEAGLAVVLVEAGRIGAGASGGLVGALTPHMPRGWRPFKAFQRDALLSLPATVEALTVETGIDTGYRRCGRLSPLKDDAARVRATEQVMAAEAHWEGSAAWHVADALPSSAEGWLCQDACAAGVQGDTLSARLTPRAYLSALRSSVERRAKLREDWPATSIRNRNVTGPAGEIGAGLVVLAAGWRALDPIALPPDFPPMQGVKGQAARLACQAPEDLPVIHADGVFVTRQGPDHVAIGSTSEREWETEEPDGALDALIAKARALVPRLSDAPVVERWSGIRPRGPGREPLAGPIPGHPGVFAATGGYKIGLGIAHRIGAALAALATGADGPALPESFLPAQFVPLREADALGPAELAPTFRARGLTGHE